MINRSRRRFKTDPAELNITAFLNLMVILVPFLLITAVFSRMTILELNIPPASENDQPDQQKKEFQLVVTIRKDSIDVGDTLGGLIKHIEKKDDEYDLKALSELLKQIKIRFPEKTNANILAEPSVSYDTLIHVMDTMRTGEQVQAGSLVKVELFPDVALGDAPPAESSSQVGGDK
jgi:biopolymer transport protein ExbD